MSDIHNLNQYSISQNVIKDFPSLIKTVDRCIRLLENGRKYKPVNEVLLLMEKNKKQMEYLLEFYNKVNTNLGKEEPNETT